MLKALHRAVSSTQIPQFAPGDFFEPFSITLI